MKVCQLTSFAVAPTNLTHANECGTSHYKTTFTVCQLARECGESTQVQQWTSQKRKSSCK